MAKAPRRSAVLLTTMLITAAAATPSAQSAGGDGVITGGRNSNSRAEQLKRDHSRVTPGPLSFGTTPYSQVESAANATIGQAGCAINTEEATNLVLAPTWPEVAQTGRAPSPMALSRYDDQTSLANPLNGARDLFFNPGVGMWQLDSSGLGTDLTAAQAMDTSTAAMTVAPYVVKRYCSAINGGAHAEDARARAWSAWHACDAGSCEDVFQRLQRGELTKVNDVDSYGGAQRRECSFNGARHACLYVDPREAQGDNTWAAPDYGPAPIPAPFYVFTYDQGGASHEVRYWSKADSGAPNDVSVSRRLGDDARDRLAWMGEPGLCDLTTGRGGCS